MNKMNKQKLTGQQMYEILKNKNLEDGCDIICDTTIMLTYDEWLEYIIETYKDHNEELKKLDDNDTANENTKIICNLTRLKFEGFREYLLQIGSESTTEEELERLYTTNVVINVDNYEVFIPFDATIYNELLKLIEKVIEEF